MNVYPPAASGGTALTTAQNAISGDQAIGAANTFVDGPSVSLVAGTWFIVGHLLVAQSAVTTRVTGRLWDGTTIYDEAESEPTGSSGTDVLQLAFCAIVTLVSTTTLKLSAAVVNLGTSPAIKANPVDNSGASNRASQIVAVKVG